MAQEPAAVEQADTGAPLPDESDEALIARFLATHHSSAFAALARRHQDFAFRVAFAQSGRRDLAEEAVQEAYLQMLRPGCRFESAGPGSFRAWLYRVVAHAAQNVARSERRTVKRPLSRRYQEGVQEMNQTHADSAGSRLEVQEESRQMLTTALSGLKEELRMPIVMHYLEGLSQTEIGQLAGLSQSVVARRISAGLELLRKRLALEGVTLAGAALPTLLAGGALLKAPSTLQSALLRLESLPGLTGLGAATVREAARQSVRTLRPVFPWWSVAGTMAGMAVVGGIGWSVLHREPNIPSAPPAASTPSPAPAPTPPAQASLPTPAPAAVPEQPVNVRWSFEKGPAPGIETLQGDWRWRAPTGKLPGRMVSGTDEDTCLLLPTRLHARPLRFSLKMTSSRPGRTRRNTIWSDGEAKLGARFWLHEPPPIIYKSTSKPTLTCHQYFVGRFSVTENEDSCVVAVQEYEKPYPGDRLLLTFLNCEVLEIELRELAPAELPEWLGDPAALIPKMERGPFLMTYERFRSAGGAAGAK